MNPFKNLFNMTKKKTSLETQNEKAEKLQQSIKSISVDEDTRDEMIRTLQDSDNPDVAYLCKNYFTIDEHKRKIANKHYVVNGSPYLNAIFRGELENAMELASEHDYSLLAK
jgi:uncharacterized membrane-anchored protein